MANVYGYPDYQSFKPLEDSIPRQFDLLEMITTDDPPIYIINLQKARFPRDFNSIEHHREHAIILSEYLEKSGVKHDVYILNDSIKSDKDVKFPIRDFMVNNVK